MGEENKNNPSLPYGLLWIKSDRLQGLPKSIFLIQFSSPLSLRLVSNLALAKMLLKVIREQLETIIQNIYKVDYDFDFTISSQGISFQLKGFSDKMADII